MQRLCLCPFASTAAVTTEAAGSGHTIALTTNQTVWTWGSDAEGALGRGGVGDDQGCDECVPTPGQVLGLSNVVAIAAGDTFMLAATSNGQVYGWGDNTDGELGTNSSSWDCNCTFFPVQVPGISNAVLVSAPRPGNCTEDSGCAVGMHAVALTVDQGTNYYWCWGDNQYGQVGIGTNCTGSCATNGTGIYQYAPAQVQFCTRCQRNVQLGTSGILTAQCNGTLYLYFNDEIDEFGDNSGSYTVTFNGSNVTVMATNNLGVVVGTVTNGGVYAYSASGSCLFHFNNPGTAVDPNGNGTNGAPWDCSDFSIINITNAVCPAAQCFSLVGKIQ